MSKDVSKIPKGCYCHEPGFLGKTCPYFKSIVDEGVVINYCSFLEQGDVGNITDAEFDVLKKKYGSDDAVWDKYPLSLLWDGCKECGENEYTEEEFEKLIEEQTNEE